MAQKILIAIDESENAMRAVQYVAENHGTETKITLFSIVPDTGDICPTGDDKLNPYFQRTAFCMLQNKKKDLLSQVLEKAKMILTDAGFEEKNIASKIRLKKNGIARDIAAEAENGYDVVVIGKRGSSGVKELFGGSSSQRALGFAKEAPIVFIN